MFAAKARHAAMRLSAGPGLRIRVPSPDRSRTSAPCALSAYETFRLRLS